MAAHELVTWRYGRNTDSPVDTRNQLQFSNEDSPDRYRLVYSYGSTSLNLATGLWTVTRYICDPLSTPINKAAASVLGNGQLSSIQGPDGADGVRALRSSLHAARLLFDIANQPANLPTLTELRLRPRRRFPRFFLTGGRLRSLSRQDYGTFLTDDVRPAAMTLMAGALQLHDQTRIPEPLPDKAPTSDDQRENQPSRRQFWRNRRPDAQPEAESQGCDPDQLAEQLDAGQVPDHKQIVKWLATQDLSYRVHFNLACYYSRELSYLDRATTDERWLEKQPQADYLKEAEDQLWSAFTYCVDAERANIAERAVRDPALTFIRDNGPNFWTIIGKTAGAESDEAAPVELPTVPDHSGGRDWRIPRVLPVQLVPSPSLNRDVTGLLQELLSPRSGFHIDRVGLRLDDLANLQEVLQEYVIDDSSNRDATSIEQALRVLYRALFWSTSWIEDDLIMPTDS